MNGKRPPVTVFLVDDEPSVLRAIGRLVRSAGWNVATFASPEEFLDQQDPQAPGCLVLDMTMPKLSGFELQQALMRAGNCLPIIFLTADGDIPMSVRAMKSGAIDFLSKPCRDKDLLAAIEQAVRRDQQLRLADTEKEMLVRRLATLTPREHEVMLHVVAGQLNKQIAADLGTVEQTIKVHRARVMQKLGVVSVADLVRLTERAGVRGK